MFSGGIKFLKDHLFRNFQERVPQLQDGDIHWMLTVPAIWDETAKKFMRKSAEEVSKLFTVLKHMVQDLVDKTIWCQVWDCIVLLNMKTICLKLFLSLE